MYAYSLGSSPAIASAGVRLRSVPMVWITESKVSGLFAPRGGGEEETEERGELAEVEAIGARAESGRRARMAAGGNTFEIRAKYLQGRTGIRISRRRATGRMTVLVAVEVYKDLLSSEESLLVSFVHKVDERVQSSHDLCRQAQHQQQHSAHTQSCSARVPHPPYPSTARCNPPRLPTQDFEQEGYSRNCTVPSTLPLSSSGNLSRTILASTRSLSSAAK